MELHFPRAIVEQLLDRTLKAKRHELLYDEPGTDKPGLWLVGDEGVYLMTNEKRPKRELPVVAYANEVNPKTMEFDLWWNAKRASFGGDDGCRFWAADEIRAALSTYRPGEDLILEVTPKSTALISWQPKPARRAPKKKA